MIISLDGNTLYVSQNMTNWFQLVILEYDPDSQGIFTKFVTDVKEGRTAQVKIFQLHVLELTIM